MNSSWFRGRHPRTHRRLAHARRSFSVRHRSPARRHEVVLALDGSPVAATGMPLARAIARQLRAELVQLHARGARPADVILNAMRKPEVKLLVLTTYGGALGPGHPLGSVARDVIGRAQGPILLLRPEATVRAATDQPFRRLLIPVDGAPATAAALGPAISIARRLHMDVDFLFVDPSDRPTPREGGCVPPPRYVDQPQHEWPAWVDRVLQQLSACLGELPPELNTRVFLKAGKVADEIMRFADTYRADVIGLVRRSHLECDHAHVLSEVLDRTTCPVLLLSADDVRSSTRRPGTRCASSGARWRWHQPIS